MGLGLRFNVPVNRYGHVKMVSSTNHTFSWASLTKRLTSTVKPILSGHLKRRPKIGFQDRLSLNAGQKYCRKLHESILQYFRPSLSYHLSLRLLFCLFLSGRLRQVLLYFRHILFACNWQKPFLNQRKENDLEIISWSISTKVWDRAGLKLAGPGSAVGLATNCATGSKHVDINDIKC